MIGDILFVLLSVIIGIIGILLLPFKAIFDATGITGYFQSAMDFLFAPLKYFGYWIDLHFLGTIIVALSGFLTLYFSYMLWAFIVSHKSGNIQHPKL